MATFVAELVGGPWDGEKREVDERVLHFGLEVRKIERPDHFRPMRSEHVEPFMSSAPILRGTYLAESDADAHAGVLRWQGWRC